MSDIVVSVLLIAGSLFMLVAALGVVKLPDVYMRMHAITKASSLSIVFFLLAVIIAHPTMGTIVSCILVLIFIIATAPVASHMMARVAHAMGIKLSKGAVMDELEDSKEYMKSNTDHADSAEK